MNDKYLQYQLEEFLADDAFVNWVLDNKNDEEWAQWVNKHPKAQSSIDNAKQSVLSLRFKNDKDISSAKERTWSRIQDATQAKEIMLKSNRRTWIYGLVAAASVALLAVFLFPSGQISYETSIAQSEAITLPMQSQVTLGSSSELSYEEESWKEERNIALSGQAHFKVTKGVPFNVATENGQVQVLGTEFDVLSRDQSFQVLVSEGKVRVSSGTIEKILTADMAFYKNPQWTNEIDIEDTWASKDILFAFNNQPLNKVLQSLSFSYGVSFQNGDLNIDHNYTGSFGSTDELQSNLKKILWPLRIAYEVNGKKVVLSSKE